MERPEKETIEFINTYRKWDILWNPNNRDYYNRIKKEDAWQEIARETNKTVEQCRKKITYLQAALRREKMKMRRSAAMGKGTDEIYRSSWFAFKSLQFLLDKNKPKQTFNTTNKRTNEVESTEVTIKNTEINFPSTSISTSTKHYFDQPIPSSKEREMTGDQCFNKGFKILANSVNVMQDESFHFGNLVAAKLRMYDDHICCAIQNDILNIFLKANTGYYNNTNNTLQSTPANFSPVSFTSQSHDTSTSEPSSPQI